MFGKLIAMNNLLIYIISFVFNFIFSDHLQTKLTFLFFFPSIKSSEVIKQDPFQLLPFLQSSCHLTST